MPTWEMLERTEELSLPVTEPLLLLDRDQGRSRDL